MVIKTLVVIDYPWWSELFPLGLKDLLSKQIKWSYELKIFRQYSSHEPSSKGVAPREWLSWHGLCKGHQVTIDLKQTGYKLLQNAVVSIFVVFWSWLIKKVKRVSPWIYLIMHSSRHFAKFLWDYIK